MPTGYTSRVQNGEITKKKGWTQARLAKEIGLANNTLRRKKMSEYEPKPCPNCNSVTNENGTCSWHCLTCAHNETEYNCVANGCHYINKEDK